MTPLEILERLRITGCQPYGSDLAQQAAKLIEDYRAEIYRLNKGNRALLGFAGAVLCDAREHMTDVCGGDIQEWAVEYGLLKEVEVTEPCGEGCECASIAEFPLTCYELTPLGTEACSVVYNKEQKP